MYKLKIGVTGLIFILMIPFFASANDPDGSKPLLCSVISVFDCGLEGACFKGSAGDINLPRFLRIDLSEKIIKGTRENGETLKSGILDIKTLQGNLLLRGIQNDKAWNMVISTATGDMTASVTGDQVGFTIFGACIVP